MLMLTTTKDPRPQNQMALKASLSEAPLGVEGATVLPHRANNVFYDKIVSIYARFKRRVGAAQSIIPVFHEASRRETYVCLFNHVFSNGSTICAPLDAQPAYCVIGGAIVDIPLPDTLNDGNKGKPVGLMTSPPPPGATAEMPPRKDGIWNCSPVCALPPALRVLPFPEPKMFGERVSCGRSTWGEMAERPDEEPDEFLLRMSSSLPLWCGC